MTTTTRELDFDGAVDALRAQRVVCAAHVDPDGDTLGSALALVHALRALGVDAVAAIGSADGRPASLPERLRVLPGAGELVTAEVEPDPAVFAVLDCAVPERLGHLADRLDRADTVVWIDHHRGEPRGAVTLVDPEAAATGEIVAELIRRLGVPLTGDVATCCFVALATDTGRFGNEATRPAALRLAADLVAGGVDVAGVSRALFASYGFEELRLLGRVLADARREPGGLVWSVVGEEDLAGAGLELGDTDGAVELLRGVDDARCALLLKQRAGGGLKGSLRSVGDVDVAAIARALGGGGHASAAGFSTDADPAEVVACVSRALDGEAPRGAAGGGAAGGAEARDGEASAG